jgi:hypothetical protein
VKPVQIVDQSEKVLINKKRAISKSTVEELPNKRRDVGERIRD